MMQKYNENLLDDCSSQYRKRQSADELDLTNSRSQGSNIIMNKKKFIETVATIVADSQLALARRPEQECPFKHPAKPSRSLFNIK